MIVMRAFCQRVLLTVFNSKYLKKYKFLNNCIFFLLLLFFIGVLNVGVFKFNNYQNVNNIEHLRYSVIAINYISLY